MPAPFGTPLLTVSKTVTRLSPVEIEGFRSIWQQKRFAAEMARIDQLHKARFICKEAAIRRLYSSAVLGRRGQVLFPISLDHVGNR